MNRRLFPFGLAFTLALFTISCRTPTGEPDVVRNQKIAASFKAAVASSVTLVVRNNPQTSAYFSQVAAVFCKAKTDNQLDPSAIIASINAIPVVQNLPVEAIITKNLIVGLVEANLSATWAITLDPNKTGGIVIEIVCDSITTGVHDAGQ